MSGKISWDELETSPLTKKHNLSSFNSSSFELNDFLKDDALINQKHLLNRSYVCFFKSRMIGFFTLTTDTITAKAVSKSDGFNNYKYAKYPAIKIARLAVDKRCERRGVGTHLLFAAIGIALSISEHVGCRYITVDSKKKSVNFYEKYNFAIVKTRKDMDFIPMYLNMYPVIKEMRPVESLNDW